jgi:DNA-binding response OmpR family regulator
MMKILVVDDDRVLADLVSFAFRREGFEVIQAHDGRTALRRWSEEQPILIVLDVNLPELDGFTICRHIREQANTPIIMLSVRGEEDDIIYGLKIGADDYMPKPFSPRQLVARAHAILRRSDTRTVRPMRQVGDLMLDATRREVCIGQSTVISLTPLENKLLAYLMINAGHILTTEAIIDHVWGPKGGSHDMVRQLIYRLRGKIEPNSTHPKYIETIPGLGYGLATADTVEYSR